MTASLGPFCAAIKSVFASYFLQHARPLAFFAIVILFALISSSALAATLPTDFIETQFASGFTNPTAMAFAPDGRLFVCQQGGQLRVFKNGALLATPFVSLTVDSNGERGLLGVAFDPDFATNNFVYVYYTATTPQVHNRVSRFTTSVANPDVAQAGSEVAILDLNNLSGATNHNGGAIHFGPDGKLYIAVGENANAANSQTIGNLLGKILRINSDGTLPADNPTTFPGIAGSPTGINRAIWSVGLRNPYTFTFQPVSGRMFINDVGQNSWEEINDGISGSNYGWSICEGACAPPNANFRDPLFQYGHGSSATTGCAITGGAFYNPSTVNFPADYVGKYFYAEFCTGWIRRFDPATGTDTSFATGISNPVDLIVTADGSLYYLARGAGSVFRVRFNGPTNNFGEVIGRITRSSDGTGISGAVLRMTGTQNRKTITDANGNYRFDEVLTSGTYTVTPSRANFSFTPIERSLSQPGNSTDAPFSGIPTGTSNNPLDTPEYFVRQHYVDFLNREPDESGFNFWSDQIISCGTDSVCIERRRVNVSAAYFLSIEFQETGGLVDSLYRTSFSRRPFYSEFVPDTQIVGQNVVVGRTGWENQLETNKQAFLNAWVQRSAFVSAYGALSDAAYVDTLISHTGVTFTSNERNALVNSLVNHTATRAQVLRQIAEDSRFKALKFNETFVMMEYFGYLRRDPDAGGFQFWLDKLNQFNGNFEQADMVKAFIVSGEYRDRFPQ
ncbi:MAG TPA: PQQ-dependent sugar dehydrogenase [Pyrinomonadaceae bacterium]|nr:PQQ-dependent sugar dehydrogenase [Pyrinomonadaceae bacterium]